MLLARLRRKRKPEVSARVASCFSACLAAGLSRVAVWALSLVVVVGCTYCLQYRLTLLAFHLLPDGISIPRVRCLSPPTHNQGPYDTSLAVIRHKKPLKVPCHEDLTPPHAGAHRTPPPARHRLTSGSSGRARLAMIASQVGFRLGLGLASPKRKGTRRQHCLRSLIRENSFNCKRCCQRRTIQGTLPARREADIHIHTISTMPVQHAEHRTITTNNCTSPVRVQQHCRMWRHLVQCATSCPEHIIVHDCRRRKRLGQPGEPLFGRRRPDRGRRQHRSREAQHRAPVPFNSAPATRRSGNPKRAGPRRPRTHCIASIWSWWS